METPLAQQSSDVVFAKEELIVAYIQEAFPSLDLSPGTALRDLVVRMYAHLETRVQEQLDLALVSSSLLEISKNPNATDDVQLERLLSNYNVTRSQGSTAAGKLRLFLSAADSTIINANTEIYINDVLFNPTESFLLLPASLYTGAPGQRLITPSGATFTSVIDLVAANSGSNGNVRTGALMASITPTPNVLISGKVDSDFTGGADADDNEVLLAKMRTGVVGKVFGGREHIKAKLKSQFSGIVDVGCVGFMDSEMRRDLVNGVHMGGAVDLFVKSASYPSRIQEQLVPQFVSFDSINKQGTFEITLNVNQASGMYSVESIKAILNQAGSYEIVSDNRVFTALDRHQVSAEAVAPFSAFQMATIRFVVPFEGMLLAWNSSQPAPSFDSFSANVNTYIQNQATEQYFKYFVEYLKMPNLEEIQAYIDLASEKSLSADMLVHAPIPVMCSVQLRLLKKTGAADIDMNKLKSAIVSKFNSYGFGEAIQGSALIHTAYENLPDGYAIDLPIHMYGVIINPDLSKDVIFSSDALKPPVNYSKGVSPRNTAFFLESNMVDVSIRDC
jgi:hypothetical protein